MNPTTQTNTPTPRTDAEYLQLKSDAAAGLDLSPGNHVAKWAVETIDLLDKTLANPTGIEFQVAQDLASRQQKGIAKYGMTVAANPLNLKQWLQHAYEEALDLAVYLKRSIVECYEPSKKPDASTEFSRAEVIGELLDKGLTFDATKEIIALERDLAEAKENFEKAETSRKTNGELYTRALLERDQLRTENETLRKQVEELNGWKERAKFTLSEQAFTIQTLKAGSLALVDRANDAEQERDSLRTQLAAAEKDKETAGNKALIEDLR